MRGFVFDIQKFALHDGPGIRTAVFLKGCELGCEWCCNPESQLPSPQLAYDVEKCTNCLDCIKTCNYGALSSIKNKLHVDFETCTSCRDFIHKCVPGALKIFGYETNAKTVIDEVLKDKKYFDNSGGGLTLSGGDPVFQPEFSFELLRLAKENGIHTCIETSGYCKTATILKLAEVTDLFLFDFKHYNTTEHIKYTKVSNAIILENLDTLCKNNHSVILRCPIIPGVNDNFQNFEVIAEISNKYQSIQEVEIMPFHNWGFHKYELIGMERPRINNTSISQETRDKWVESLRKLGCTKVKS